MSSPVSLTPWTPPNELGLLHRPRLPGAARLDGRVRPPRDLAAGGDLARARARWPDAQAIAPLQEEVKERGLWATHLPPELGGQGMGQVRLGLMHEILGTSPIAPLAFGNAAPDSGNSEILAMAGTPRAEGPLAASAARRRPAQRLQHDRAGHARLRSDAAAHARRARRRGVGDRRAASGSPPTARSPTS